VLRLKKHGRENDHAGDQAEGAEHLPTIEDVLA
jgi:hypothetical protein